MIRITDHLSKAAFCWPDNPAVTCNQRTLSWLELNNGVEALARTLFAAGVRGGDRVAYLGFNSISLMECYYAPSLIGAAIVPLNFRLSTRELIECVHDCRPKILVVDDKHIPQAQAIQKHCPEVEMVFHSGSAPTPYGMQSYKVNIAKNHQEIDFDALSSHDDDMLIMFYTGGTTGKPKGVMLSHANLFSNALGTINHMGLKEREVYLSTGPLFHTGAGSRIYMAPFLGAHMVLMPQFDIVVLMELVAKYEVNLIQFVPTMMSMILDHPLFCDFDMSSLRFLSYGAAPMPPDLLERTLNAFPDVKFGQAYGMTEASPVLTVLSSDYHTEDGQKLGKINSVGKPVSFVDIRIIGPDDMMLPAGNIGEIIARGPNIMLGYWDKPDMTAEAIQDGWYHTRDSGYLDSDGFLYISGRTKDMIITGGENVYPIEVEDIIAQHPAVKQCAVIGAPDKKWGERVHAIIVTQSENAVSSEDIIAYCREHLAHYKCPTLITFQLDALPLTNINKIDKNALRARHEGSGKV